jgi:hypothetical protein
MAPLPATLIMAQVLLPSFSASLAIRDISRGLAATCKPSNAGRDGFGLDTPDVAREMQHNAGTFDFYRITSGTDHRRRPQNRSAFNRRLQPAPVDHAAHQAPDTCPKLSRNLPGFARGFRE